MVSLENAPVQRPSWLRAASSLSPPQLHTPTPSRFLASVHSVPRALLYSSVAA